MKKNNNILKKILIIIIILLCNGSGILNSTYSSDKVNDLKFENVFLKNKIILLEKKLKDVETNLKKINDYDNNIYSQLLGINEDTININLYKNDSIDFIRRYYDFITANLTARSKHASELTALQLIKFEKKSELIQKNKNAFNYYPTLSPIKTNDFICITTGFGWNIHPIYHTPVFHEGVDISANIGSKVYATASGKIDYILYSKYGYGNRIVIKHLYGYETLYAHLDIVYVYRGQYVKKGQLIGTVGSTGLSTGSHLHYEVHLNNNYKDPLGYFYTYLTSDLIKINTINN